MLTIGHAKRMVEEGKIEEVLEDFIATVRRYEAKGSGFGFCQFVAWDIEVAWRRLNPGPEHIDRFKIALKEYFPDTHKSHQGN